ncbi:MAG TPA: aminotransferase class V-fold PLP-dependent enzyme, partial [Rhizomicrobium sp.]|nr:aminotransferase class V-fold PLP-dependent enzyme [Rhizomicrobium sp.]
RPRYQGRGHFAAMKGFSRTFAGAGAPLHVAAHSHHPWPDVTYDAQIAAWEDAARLLDHKWDHVFAATIPAAQTHIARQLALPDPATIAFAPNTHSLVLRILSCLPRDRPLCVLTTGSEFMSFARQFARLEEDGAVRVTRVTTEPFDTFEDRFAAEAQKPGWDLVFFSQVFFDSGFAVRDLAHLVGAVADKSTFVVIDGYHGFMAVPTDLSAVADRAFYVAGGYKYAMAGEGACFLHAPLGYGPRPRDTGWYAGFAALEAGTDSVPYASDGSRFLGATFDVSAIYRFNAVQDWLRAEGLTVQAMLAHVRHIEDLFLWEVRSPNVSRLTLVVPEAARRGRFLAFRTPKAGEIIERLAAHNIIADHRGDRLRIGFGIYHTEKDAKRLAAALV